MESKKTKDNIITDRGRALKVWEKNIQDLYDSENRPNDIVIEAEEELDEDDKGSNLLESMAVQADLLKEQRDNRLNTMAILVNKVYVSGRW